MTVIDDRIVSKNGNNHQHIHYPLSTKVDAERMTSMIDSSDSDDDINDSNRNNDDSKEPINGQSVVLSSSPNTVAYELASCHINNQNYVFETAATTTTMPPFLISPSRSPPPTARWPVLQPSVKSLQTHNPIREIVDPIISAASSKKASSDHDSSPSSTRISLAVRTRVETLLLQSKRIRFRLCIPLFPIMSLLK